MNEHVVDTIGAEQPLGPVYLEAVRNEALSRIANDTRLTPQQKSAAASELDFLIDSERLRRARQLRWQWRNERREHIYAYLCRRQQIEMFLQEQREESTLKLMRLRRDAIRCRVETVLELRRLARKREDADLLRQARQELLRLRLRHRLTTERERMAAHGVRTQTLKRDEFRQLVRERFPEREEELMDDYDRFVNERMERRSP